MSAEAELAAAESECAANPDDARAHGARGRALMKLGRRPEALAAFERARALAPESAEAHLDVGVAREHIGRLRGAARAYREAIARAPESVPALMALASLLLKIGQTGEVIAVCERILVVEPGHGRVAHWLAALRGEIPAVAPRDYVVDLFDGYAGHFDEHMLGTLDYRAPALVHEALSGSFAGRGFARALDLGCGTGLVGSVLRPRVRELHGIDLSARMIEKAREANLYDRLEVVDIIAYLTSAPEPRYDLVTACDVFIYVGDLAPVMAAVRGRMEAGGLFLFTVERLDQGDVQLRISGRYAHGRDHVTGAAAAAGLELLACDAIDLRLDFGEPVTGWLYVLRARQAHGSMDDGEQSVAGRGGPSRDRLRTG